MRVPSEFFFEEINFPLERVAYLSSTVIRISSVVFVFGASIVGNQTEFDSVSPCVHICGILDLSSPFGFIKNKPLSDVIAALPLTVLSSGFAT